LWIGDSAELVAILTAEVSALEIPRFSIYHYSWHSAFIAAQRGVVLLSKSRG